MYALPASALAAEQEIPASASNDRPAASGTDDRARPTIASRSSGADLDQAAAIKRIAPQYKLRVEISGRGGSYYVADRLQLMKRGQVIAEVPDAGPWLLFDVPAGQYTLLGDFADKQVKRDVTVAGSGTTVHWVLPSSVE